MLTLTPITSGEPITYSLNDYQYALQGDIVKVFNTDNIYCYSLTNYNLSVTSVSE